MKFFQARADIAGVIGADSLLLHADVDQVVVNRRVAMHAVVPSALARRPMRGFGHQRRLTWVDCARRKRNERVAEIVDRFLVLRPDRAHANGRCKDENRSGIHSDKIQLEKARSQKRPGLFVKGVPKQDSLDGGVIWRIREWNSPWW